MSAWRPAVLTAFAALGCNELLDVEDARVDPTLLPSRGGSAGTVSTNDAGKGGSGGTGGTSPATGGSSSAGRGGSGEEAGADGMEDGGAPPSSGGKGSAGAEAFIHGGKAGSSSAGSAGAGTAGRGGGGAGTAGTSGEPMLTLCERYCDAVMTNCKGRYEQYRDFSQCVDVCRVMDAGSTGERDVDTVECRLRQAGFAASEPFQYCKSSGPLGAGECGSNCASYCNLMQKACTSESTEGNLEPSYFDTTEDCLSSCTALVPTESTPDEYTSSATADPPSFVGNHVYCRAYHVTSAIVEGAPDEHCPHAWGAEPCVD